MRPLIFTTPPQPRSPSAKHPLFTRRMFSTKSFGPGHIVGTGILVLGTYAIAKAFISHGQAAAESTRREALPSRPERTAARAENERGQYGKAP